jgi:hypothetical protein
VNLRFAPNCGLQTLALLAGLSPLEQGSIEGETPVRLAFEAGCL